MPKLGYLMTIQKLRFFLKLKIAAMPDLAILDLKSSIRGNPLAFIGFQKKGDKMKTTSQAKSWTQPQNKPTALKANQLSSIKVKGYTLIGFRDLETEAAANSYLDFLKTEYQFNFPRLYTLVSQNRSISIKENLSHSNRLFLNFESFKWSELFFSFFRHIMDEKTERFVFKNLLYSIDLYLVQYRLMLMALKKLSHPTPDALQRHEIQKQIISMLQCHPQKENLCLLFILDLLLISIGKSHYASCGFMVSRTESVTLLNYFRSQTLFAVESDKLIYSGHKATSCFKKYFNFRGRILFTNNIESIFSENQFSFFKSIFEKKEQQLELKTFQTCFTHI